MLLRAGELAANNLMQFAPSAPDATCDCTADEERYEARMFHKIEGRG